MPEQRRIKILARDKHVRIIDLDSGEFLSNLCDVMFCVHWNKGEGGDSSISTASIRQHYTEVDAITRGNISKICPSCLHEYSKPVKRLKELQQQYRLIIDADDKQTTITAYTLGTRKHPVFVSCGISIDDTALSAWEKHVGVINDEKKSTT